MVSIEFGMLLCLFFIISKSLYYSIEFGTFAFLFCKEGTYNKLDCFLKKKKKIMSCPSVFAFMYLVYIWFLCFVISILSTSLSYLLFFFYFFFFLFDECLIFSLIDSIIFPITNTWFELMEVCATHILSPIVSFGLNRWRYILVLSFFFFFFLLVVIDQV